MSPLINLAPEDKTWLDRKARSRNVPVTELVHEAIREYRIRQQILARANPRGALERTAGIRCPDDALAYQHRLRDEWDDWS